MSEDSDLDKFTREWVVRAGDINMRSRHAAFRSLLAIAVALEPITYKMLTKPEAQAKPLMEKRWASI